MSVDARLYLNTRWGLDDIKRVIERTQNSKVEAKANCEVSLGYFNFFVKGRMIHVFTNHQTPLGTATSLSLGSNPEAIKIFRDIAEVLGGVLQEQDYEEKYEFIDGNMYEENALPYFLKYAILEDGIDPDDIDGLVASRKAWEKKYKH